MELEPDSSTVTIVGSKRRLSFTWEDGLCPDSEMSFLRGLFKPCWLLEEKKGGSDTTGCGE